VVNVLDDADCLRRCRNHPFCHVAATNQSIGPMQAMIYPHPCYLYFSISRNLNGSSEVSMFPKECPSKTPSYLECHLVGLVHLSILLCLSMPVCFSMLVCLSILICLLMPVCLSMVVCLSI
jgi:hypothetical protein